MQTLLKSVSLFEFVRSNYLTLFCDASKGFFFFPGFLYFFNYVYECWPACMFVHRVCAWSLKRLEEG